jgi:hypothetical protein
MTLQELPETALHLGMPTASPGELKIIRVSLFPGDVVLW